MVVEAPLRRSGNKDGQGRPWKEDEKERNCFLFCFRCYAGKAAFQDGAEWKEVEEEETVLTLDSW